MITSQILRGTDHEYVRELPVLGLEKDASPVTFKPKWMRTLFI